MAGISKLGAERYGRMFAQLTDESWLFGVLVAAVFLCDNVMPKLWHYLLSSSLSTNN
ncbi:hypothetical protein [Photobacterium kishitanii]|uniref:hypothetical protein n=1 Tax=Photobacterium kishitanii TaxID=318456 RepID=UPI00273A3952|nr:hypothetical protein [Photobacterium kishitanii]